METTVKAVLANMLILEVNENNIEMDCGAMRSS
jgi:hypothetical protein